MYPDKDALRVILLYRAPSFKVVDVWQLRQHISVQQKPFFSRKWFAATGFFAAKRVWIAARRGLVSCTVGK
jgi:hypothetical protein